jgi:hypothetical protein
MTIHSQLALSLNFLEAIVFAIETVHLCQMEETKQPKQAQIKQHKPIWRQCQ